MLDASDRLWALVGWCLYLSAWGITTAAVSTITTTKGTNEWIQGGPALGSRFNQTLLKPAAAPDGVVAFYVVTFLIFSSFGVHHAITAFRNLGTGQKSNYLCIANAPKATEYGYLALSAVAKTVLHLFLGLTVLSQAEVGTPGRNPRGTMEAQQDVYAKGFGGATGIILGVAAAFAAVAFRYREKTTPGGAAGSTWVEPAGQQGGRAPAERGWAGLTVNRVRWADYVVSAPIMYAVLSASWGLMSQPLLIIGVALHAAAIGCAAMAEPKRARTSANALRVQELMVVHTLCACIHTASAIAILAWAAHIGAVDAALPLKRSLSTQSLGWFYVCGRDDAPQASVGRWQDWCKTEAPRRGMRFAMEAPTNPANFYIVPWAATFALWSAAGHAYTLAALKWGGK